MHIQYSNNLDYLCDKNLDLTIKEAEECIDDFVSSIQQIREALYALKILYNYKNIVTDNWQYFGPVQA